jgi:hypothetical protein
VQAASAPSQVHSSIARDPHVTPASARPRVRAGAVLRPVAGVQGESPGHRSAARSCSCALPVCLLFRLTSGVVSRASQAGMNSSASSFGGASALNTAGGLPANLLQVCPDVLFMGAPPSHAVHV